MINSLEPESDHERSHDGEHDTEPVGESLGQEEEQEVGTEGSELTLGEVEHPGPLVDEDETQSDEPVDEAVHDSEGDERVGTVHDIRSEEETETDQNSED